MSTQDDIDSLRALIHNKISDYKSVIRKLEKMRNDLELIKPTGRDDGVKPISRNPDYQELNDSEITTYYNKIKTRWDNLLNRI